MVQVTLMYDKGFCSFHPGTLLFAKQHVRLWSTSGTHGIDDLQAGAACFVLSSMTVYNCVLVLADGKVGLVNKDLVLWQSLPW